MSDYYNLLIRLMNAKRPPELFAGDLIFYLFITVLFFWKETPDSLAVPLKYLQCNMQNLMGIYVCSSQGHFSMHRNPFLFVDNFCYLRSPTRPSLSVYKMFCL